MSSTVAWPSPFTPAQEAEGDVAGAAGDVEQPHAPAAAPASRASRPSRAGGRRGSSRRSSGRSGGRPRRRRPARAPAFSASRHGLEAEVGAWARRSDRAAGFRSVPPLLIRRARGADNHGPPRGGDLPELPEVETVRRGLEPVLAGRVIARADVRRPDLRWPFPPRIAARLTGARVTALRRRSKYLLGRPRPRRDADRAPRHVRPPAGLRRAGRRLPPPAPGAGEARPRGARHRGRRAGHASTTPAGSAPSTSGRPRRSRRTGCWPGSAPSRSATAFDGRRLAGAAGRPGRPRSRRCCSTSAWSRASATSTSARRSGAPASRRSGWRAT